MKKSGTNTKSIKTEKKTQSVKPKATTPNTLTLEEKDLTIKLIDTAAYYMDYMLTDFDRKVIRDIKRKIINEAAK